MDVLTREIEGKSCGSKGIVLDDTQMNSTNIVADTRVWDFRGDRKAL
jgi:hypothetical protein